MRTITIHGLSDDLILISGTRPADGEPGEFYADEDDSGIISIRAEDAGLFVIVEYARRNISACWAVGLCQIDEGVPLPDWPMRWSTHENGYSAQLEIDVPDEAVVSQAFPKEEE